METPANTLVLNYQPPKFRILYVGRDLELVVALRKSFGKPDYHVVSCPNRSEAIRLLKSEIPYHLFVFDSEMQELAALELTRLARSLYHRKRTPVILVAGEGTGELEELGRSADACVTKSAGTMKVVETIQRFLCERLR